MKILVTGGAGFLGQHITKLLLRDNAVRIFDLPGARETAELLIADGADYVGGDVQDYESLEKACRGCDAVIHLAAMTSVIESMERPDITRNVNINGTINALRSCVQNGIRKMVFASSAAVYGNCDSTPVSEQDKTEPSSPYGQSKLDAEIQVRDFSDRFGICGICLRIFNVYGRGQKKVHAGVISRFMEDISRGRKILINGDGRQTRDFVAVSDVSAAFVLALEASGSATYNIASGMATSINEMAEMLARVCGRDVTVVHGKENEGEIRHSVADITLARSNLGFEPKIRLEKGLEDLASVADQCRY